MYGKLKLNECLVAKLHLSDLVNTIFYLVYFNVAVHKLCKMGLAYKR